MRRFARTFGVSSETRILDVGGTPFNWSLIQARPQVTIVNMPRAREAFDDPLTFVFADGCRLPFKDDSFEIVFSNSVIEHVGDAENQRQFANEIARVGRAYWVQTPNFWFPIEPHLLMPFLHFLPPAWQQRIARWATVWELIERPSPDVRQFYVEHYLRDIRLLDARNLQALFPGATVERERLLGVTKSLIAVRSSDRALRPGTRSETSGPHNL